MSPTEALWKAVEATWKLGGALGVLALLAGIAIFWPEHKTGADDCSPYPIDCYHVAGFKLESQEPAALATIFLAFVAAFVVALLVAAFYALFRPDEESPIKLD